MDQDPEASGRAQPDSLGFGMPGTGVGSQVVGTDGMVLAVPAGGAAGHPLQDGAEQIDQGQPMGNSSGAVNADRMEQPHHHGGEVASPRQAHGSAVEPPPQLRQAGLLDQGMHGDVAQDAQGAVGAMQHRHLPEQGVPITHPASMQGPAAMAVHPDSQTDQMADAMQHLVHNAADAMSHQHVSNAPMGQGADDPRLGQHLPADAHQDVSLQADAMGHHHHHPHHEAHANGIAHHIVADHHHIMQEHHIDEHLQDQDDHGGLGSVDDDDEATAASMQELMEAAAAGDDDNDTEPLLHYPEPMCSHQELLDSAETFNLALKSLQEHLVLPLEKIPKVAGNELNLHLLYIHTTTLGGCSRVTQKKLWKDVAEPFEFPPTITSSSYTLRRAYINFLWDLEQVYFNGKTGTRIPPPVVKDRADESERARKRAAADNVLTHFPGLTHDTQTAFTGFASGMTSGVGPYLVGQRGSCIIDARFDCGYFCTIRFGKQEFKGVLYCPPMEFTIEPQVAMPSPGSSLARKGTQDAADMLGAALGIEDIPSAKKRKKSGPKDPNDPKPNKTAFNFFAVDARAKVKAKNPELTMSTEIAKKVGEMWQKADEEERAPYVAMATKDKQRYTAELEARSYRMQAQNAESIAQAAVAAVSTAQQAATQGTPMSLDQLDMVREAMVGGGAAADPPPTPLNHKPFVASCNGIYDACCSDRKLLQLDVSTSVMPMHSSPMQPQGLHHMDHAVPQAEPDYETLSRKRRKSSKAHQQPLQQQPPMQPPMPPHHPHQPAPPRQHHAPVPHHPATGTVVGTTMEQLIGAAGYVQVVPVAQVDMSAVPGLAMGQVAYDANGNPLSVAMAPPPPPQQQ